MSFKNQEQGNENIKPEESGIEKILVDIESLMDGDISEEAQKKLEKWRESIKGKTFEEMSAMAEEMKKKIEIEGKEADRREGRGGSV